MADPPLSDASDILWEFVTKWLVAAWRGGGTVYPYEEK
jgi:hypothetical protein